MVLFSVIAVAPFYPSLFWMVYWNNSVYEFNRWSVDESNIIGSFLEEEKENYSNNSFLSIEASSNTKRDLSSTTEIITHTVKEWESYDSIANVFWVTKESIFWANNLSQNNVLEAGKELKIPPVSWLIYTVKSWDTLSSIAANYSIDVQAIKDQNNSEEWKLVQWSEIILPGAKKKEPIPVKTQPVLAKSKVTTSSNSGWYSFAKAATSSYVPPVSGWYELVRRQPQHTFYWGNCTRFVGQYKNVNWWGNANAWLRNARAKWHATWYQATPGAIIVFWGSWYNPRYWHVGIVKKVEWNELVVVDMNYRRLNEITYRRISASSASIRGYIYVD